MAEARTLALVGSESLLGREVRDIFSTGGPAVDIRPIAAGEEESGVLTRVGEEPAIVIALSAENLSDARVILLAGPAESSRKALELAGDPPDAAIVDLTFVAEERADARLRAPMLEEDAEEAREEAVHVVAHPAAIALALFLRRLERNDPIRRAVVQIFVPASEHGARGVEELQQQTVSLLSFKPLPQAIFDTQAGFNLLARYGTEAPASLEETELRIERHLATLLDWPGEGEGAPMPSLRVVQAPVFHGYSFSVWVEFEEAPAVDALQDSLERHGVDVRGEEFEPPNVVGQAGQSGIAVGAISPDRNHADACWFWLVADNLRLAAENAVAVARELL